MIKIKDVNIKGIDTMITYILVFRQDYQKYICKPNEKCSVCEFNHTNQCCNGVIVNNENQDYIRGFIAGTKSNLENFLKSIVVSCDITAPLYWWYELDRYTPNLTLNNTDIINKICNKEFTLDDFSHKHLFTCEDKSYNCGICPRKADAYYGEWESEDVLKLIIESLNKARYKYCEAKIKPMKNKQLRSELMEKYLWQIIQLLPNSYNEKRKIQFSYATLLRIYEFCKNHKLDEWRDFCDWILSLPYFKEICLED